MISWALEKKAQDDEELLTKAPPPEQPELFLTRSCHACLGPAAGERRRRRTGGWRPRFHNTAKDATTCSGIDHDGSSSERGKGCPQRAAEEEK